MTYRANVTDKQQADIERAEDDSAIRFASFGGAEGATQNTGETKSIKANDLSAQAASTNSTPSAMKQIPGSGSVIGTHDDKPHTFATPGKA